MADLVALVEAAHALGIKVIQDQVANHTGPYHPWVADPPTPTWFNGTEAKHVANTWQTWTLQDPHAPPQAQRDDARRVVHRHPARPEPGRRRGRALHHPEHAVVGGRARARRHPAGHVAVRAARVLAALDGGAQARVPAADGRRRAVRRRPVRSCRSSRAAPRDSTAIDTKVDALFDFPLFYPIRRAFARRQARCARWRRCWRAITSIPTRRAW